MQLPCKCAKHTARSQQRSHLLLSLLLSRSGTVACRRRRPAVADELRGAGEATLLLYVSGSTYPVALDASASWMRATQRAKQCEYA